MTGDKKRDVPYRSHLSLVTCCLSLATLVTCSLSRAHADELDLTSGQTLKGLVVEEHLDRLIVSTADGEQVIRRRDIDEGFFDDPERNYLYLGNEALAGGDLNGATTLFQKALQFNPRLEEVRDAIQRTEDIRRKLVSGWTVNDPVAAVWTRWGMRLAGTGDYPVVEQVAAGRAAAQAGLRVGDRLVAVWGASTGFRALPDVAAQILGPQATPVKFTLQREIVLPPPHTAAMAWPGIELSLGPQGAMVAAAGAAGLAAGVQVGDLVVALDGRATRYMPLAAARAALAAARGRGITLRVQRTIESTRPS